MKALVTSIVTFALCLLAMIGSVLAQAGFHCHGPYDGCVPLTCFPDANTCEDINGMRIGPIYAAYKEVPGSMHTCALGSGACSDDVETVACSWTYFETYDIDTNTCDDEIITTCEPSTFTQTNCDD